MAAAIAIGACLSASTVAIAVEETAVYKEISSRQNVDITATPLAKESSFLAEALSIAQNMEASEERSSILIDVAKTYTLKGDIEDAIHLLDVTERETKAISCANLHQAATVYASIGNLEKAVELLKRSLALTQSQQASCKSFTDVIETVSKIQDDSVASSVLGSAFYELSEVEDTTKRSLIIQDLAIAYSHLSDKDAARSQIAQLLGTIESLESSPSAYSRSLISIAKAATKLSDRNMALSILEQVEATNVSYLFGQAASIYAQLEEPKKAKALLNRAQLSIPENEDSFSYRRLVEDIVTAYIELGDDVAAQHMIERLPTDTSNIQAASIAYKSIPALTRLADVYGQQGNTYKQQAVLQQVIDVYIGADSYTDYVQWKILLFEVIVSVYAQAEGELSEEVLSLLTNLIQSEQIYTYPHLGTLAQAAIQKGDIELVDWLFEQTVRSLELSVSTQNISAYQTADLALFTEIYGRFTSSSVATDRLQWLNQLAKSIDNGERRRELLEAIARAYIDLS